MLFGGINIDMICIALHVVSEELTYHVLAVGMRLTCITSNVDVLTCANALTAESCNPQIIDGYSVNGVRLFSPR